MTNVGLGEAGPVSAGDGDDASNGAGGTEIRNFCKIRSSVAYEPRITAAYLLRRYSAMRWGELGDELGGRSIEAMRYSTMAAKSRMKKHEVRSSRTSDRGGTRQDRGSEGAST